MLATSDPVRRVVDAWMLTPKLHVMEPGATDKEISSFEAKVGWSLPAEWHSVYKIVNGAHLLEGNLRLYPLRGEEFSVLRASKVHVKWGWSIPSELQLAGDNGCGTVFGIWLPSQNSLTGAVVQNGEIFEPNCLGVGATSLGAFLLARTAYYTLLLDPRGDVLDALELPAELRGIELDEGAWTAILRWADPQHPGNDDPYDARLDVGGVNHALGVAG